MLHVGSLLEYRLYVQVHTLTWVGPKTLSMADIQSEIEKTIHLKLLNQAVRLQLQNVLTIINYLYLFDYYMYYLIIFICSSNIICKSFINGIKQQQDRAGIDHFANPNFC